MLLISDPKFLEHRTPQGHPECPERLRAVERALAEADWPEGTPRREEAATVRMADLTRVHLPDYVEGIRRRCASGGGALDADTHLSRGSHEAARRAAGAAVQGVRHVLKGAGRTAFCLVRPPGHHALPGRAMGFCIFNNAAVAAAAALEEHKAGKVLIVDWDLHHGNGTEAIFIEDPRVFYCSLHRYPFWPGSGSARERGQGKGLGTTLNVPLAADSSRKEVRACFRAALAKVASTFSPRLVILSAGFDMHRDDPLGGLSLEAEDYGEMTLELAEIFLKRDAAGIVSCLEGGYNPRALAASASAHVRALREIACHV